MAREKKPLVEEEESGAPEWMVTFSDCMTLLLTFFVLLLSFSSFSDVANYRKMTVSFSDRFPSLTQSPKERRDMVSDPPSARPRKEIEKGSEIRSDIERSGEAGGLEHTEEPDFREKKIFVVASDKIYWGKGVVLSAQGRAVLGDLASFIKEVPNRVVISECEPGGLSSVDEVGLQRAWSVLDYLKRLGVEMDRLSISSVSTIMNEGESSTDKKRALQIVLLERDIYH